MTEIVGKLGNNIKTIKYDTIICKWIVQYKTRLKSDYVSDENILDFIENA